LTRIFIYFIEAQIKFLLNILHLVLLKPKAKICLLFSLRNFYWACLLFNGQNVVIFQMHPKLHWFLILNWNINGMHKWLCLNYRCNIFTESAGHFYWYVLMVQLHFKYCKESWYWPTKCVSLAVVLFYARWSGN